MFILFEVTKMFLVIVLVNCNDPDTQYSEVHYSYILYVIPRHLVIS